MTFFPLQFQDDYVLCQINKFKKQKGFARDNSHQVEDIFELTNAMLIESGAPLHFWGETILSACQVLIRVPHKKSHTTPFEM